LPSSSQSPGNKKRHRQKGLRKSSGFEATGALRERERERDGHNQISSDGSRICRRLGEQQIASPKAEVQKLRCVWYINRLEPEQRIAESSSVGCGGGEGEGQASKGKKHGRTS